LLLWFAYPLLIFPLSSRHSCVPSTFLDLDLIHMLPYWTSALVRTLDLDQTRLQCLFNSKSSPP
jgi:hypothetical protein